MKLSQDIKLPLSPASNIDISLRSLESIPFNSVMRGHAATQARSTLGERSNKSDFY